MTKFKKGDLVEWDRGVDIGIVVGFSNPFINVYWAGNKRVVETTTAFVTAFITKINKENETQER